MSTDEIVYIWHTGELARRTNFSIERGNPPSHLPIKFVCDSLLEAWPFECGQLSNGNPDSLQLTFAVYDSPISIRRTSRALIGNEDLMSIF